MIGARFWYERLGKALTITGSYDGDGRDDPPGYEYTFDEGGKHWMSAQSMPSRVVKIPVLSHTNYATHFALVDQGAYVHRHEPDSFEEDGDPENGPSLTGGAAYDIYMGDSHDIIIDGTGLIVHMEGIDWDAERWHDRDDFQTTSDVGARVYVVTDYQHVGVIEQLKGDQAYVRWHKGFATWEDVHKLRIEHSEQGEAP